LVAASLLNVLAKTDHNRTSLFLFLNPSPGSCWKNDFRYSLIWG